MGYHILQYNSYFVMMCMIFKNRSELNNYIAERTHTLEIELLDEWTDKSEFNIDEIYGRIERETRRILESCEIEEL